MKEILGKSGLIANDPKFRKECRLAKVLYEWYEGKPLSDPQDLGIQDPQGQDWKVNDELDYTPTKEVRNFSKKLLDKQARFMFGVSPTVTFEALNDGDREKAEDKANLFNAILEETGFWRQTYKAFLDSTIAKRVLLTTVMEQGKPIHFRYFTLPEFTYETDPRDINKLVKVKILYQEESTVGNLAPEQRWHLSEYYLEENEQGETKCLYSYKLVTGDGDPVFEEIATGVIDPITRQEEKVQNKIESVMDTGLTKLPCQVIINGGLTGDIEGKSDLQDLMELANSYNRVNSDYRDALRFKMFEQPVFIDADSGSLANVKIAPNAIIDLKTDPALGDGTGAGRPAQVTTLSSNFNFVQGTDSYLDRLKQDMYDLMDQPLPDEIKQVPSGKALKFMFFDLISRCEEKWQTWEPAIKQMLSILEEGIMFYKLYEEKQGIETIQVVGEFVLAHNYPIPEDELDDKKIAIEEVINNVRSHTSYITKYGDIHDAEAEFEKIIEEMDRINTSANAMMMPDGSSTSLADPFGSDPTGHKEDESIGEKTGEKATPDGLE